MKRDLQENFGNIDIYLFDQLLKGRFDDCKTVMDAGCGAGRNLVYFLRNNFQVFGIDQDTESINKIKKLSAAIAPHNPLENFRVCLVEEMPFENAFFDIVISSAVFHFANDESHFDKMLKSAWRVLKPGGFLFARLASDIGIEKKVTALGNRRYRLPDGSDRFLVNEDILLNYTKELNGELYENIKTTNVQNLRCMTTWCLQKK
ncbi:MAG: methyltransferase protein [Chitinophagaceae bacterium]|nr:methyltransferase protein [Chitinophagaceae bacterium]